MFRYFWQLSILSCLVSSVSSQWMDTQCPDGNVAGGSLITSSPLLTSRYLRGSKNKLTIMQYNVEWLFIDYYATADCPGNGCTWQNETTAETHMNYVYDVLQDVRPDIINFCEIEGCDELNILQNKFSSNGDDSTYMPYLIKGTDTATGQNVGMMTHIAPIQPLTRSETKANYPISGSQCGYTGDTSSTGVSKHYISEFHIYNTNIAIISAHLIAYPTDKSRCAKREAQAVVLQESILNYINRGYEIIMMGDFNDYDGEVLDINSHKPISMVLDILKGNAGPHAGKYSLQSVAQMISQEERYSDWYDSDNNCDTYSIKDYSMIDHILVTSVLYSKIYNTYIYHKYKEFCGKKNSDHYPVIVEFVF